MNRSTYTFFFLSLLSAGAIFADTFGSGGNKFTMDFVPITGGANADPNPDASNLIHYGAVPYDYRMGKYEVSRAMINAYNVFEWWSHHYPAGHDQLRRQWSE